MPSTPSKHYYTLKSEFPLIAGLYLLYASKQFKDLKSWSCTFKEIMEFLNKSRFDGMVRRNLHLADFLQVPHLVEELEWLRRQSEQGGKRWKPNEGWTLTKDVDVKGRRRSGLETYARNVGVEHLKAFLAPDMEDYAIQQGIWLLGSLNMESGTVEEHAYRARVSESATLVQLRKYARGWSYTFTKPDGTKVKKSIGPCLVDLQSGKPVRVKRLVKGGKFRKDPEVKWEEEVLSTKKEVVQNAPVSIPPKKAVLQQVEMEFVSTDRDGKVPKDVQVTASDDGARIQVERKDGAYTVRMSAVWETIQQQAGGDPAAVLHKALAGVVAEAVGQRKAELGQRKAELEAQRAETEAKLQAINSELGAL